jgi:hypothetical protein
MRLGQRLGYLLNEWMVAWLLLYAVAAYFWISSDTGSSQDTRTAVGWWCLVAVALFGPIFLKKWWLIRKSEQRVKAAEEQVKEKSAIVSASWR